MRLLRTVGLLCGCAALVAAGEIDDRIALYARSVDGADTELASRIWSKSPDVSFIHPLGHEHGFDQVRDDVYRKLMGETFSKRKLSPKNIVAHVDGNTAWAEFDWVFEATMRKDGAAVRTEGRETQIYRKEGGAWRLVHVHYSAMPQAGPGRGL